MLILISTHNDLAPLLIGFGNIALIYFTPRKAVLINISIRAKKAERMTRYSLVSLNNNPYENCSHVNRVG
jgi:hypothetical protein